MIHNSSFYNDDNKKITTERLKNLRENKKDNSDKVRSHKKLQKQLEEKYGIGIISDRTLMNLEADDPKHPSYKNIISTKNLLMLADFYGVSCDYLLGRESSNLQTLNELCNHIGLDRESIAILKYLKSELNCRIKGIPFIINELIHSYDINSQEPPEFFPKIDKPYIEKGLLNKICLYLLSSPIDFVVDTFNLSEPDHVSITEEESLYMFLLMLQDSLMKSRASLIIFRDYYKNSFESRIKKRKMKEEKEALIKSQKNYTDKYSKPLRRCIPENRKW